MKTLAALILCAAIFGLGMMIALIYWPIGTPTKNISAKGDLRRGAYLARAAGCVACHTDPADSAAFLAGGAPLKTDFGIFHPPNLTPDPDHGIGNWTVDAFARAVRQGISPQGEPYYPSFTYPFYSELTDQDIADLWAVFRNVPAVARPAPDHELAFPFNLRWGIKLWRATFLSAPPIRQNPTHSVTWNRGQELVHGVGHCGACHTPRNMFGGRIKSAQLSGNDRLPGGSKAPSLIGDALRARGWTIDAIAEALKTGITPSGDVFAGSMAEVIRFGTSFLTPADRTAIATYLLGDPPVAPAQ